jgi:hypothetical protein
MQGTYARSDGKEVGLLRWWWRWQWCRYKDGANKARARGQWRQTSTGEARATQQWHHKRSDEGGGKWLGKGAQG